METNKPDDVISAEKSKLLVEKGYDKIATTYADWTNEKPSARVEYLENLLLHLKDASTANALELGCGWGIPCTSILSTRVATTVANDISQAQIDLAKSRVPANNVQWLKADMMSLSFEPSSFQAIAAYYSIIHLPRDEQRTMFSRIWTWISPGGYFVANFGTKYDPGSINENWLGSKMYWSGFDAEVCLQILKEIGFQIVKSEVLQDDEDGRSVPFLWVLATKGSGA